MGNNQNQLQIHQNNDGYANISIAGRPAKPPANIAEWTRLFNIYSSVYCTQHVHASHDLFKYVNKINSFHKRYENTYVWRAYDELFRQVKTAIPDLCWTKTDFDVLEEAMSMCNVVIGTSVRN